MSGFGGASGGAGAGIATAGLGSALAGIGAVAALPLLGPSVLGPILSGLTGGEDRPFANVDLGTFGTKQGEGISSAQSGLLSDFIQRLIPPGANLGGSQITFRPDNDELGPLTPFGVVRDGQLTGAFGSVRRHLDNSA